MLPCTQTDAAAKRSEFILWALEVKKVDVESLGRLEEKELFKDYIEDYNTGGLGAGMLAYVCVLGSVDHVDLGWSWLTGAPLGLGWGCSELD